MSSSGANANFGNPIVVSGGAPDNQSIQDLAKNALDSIRVAGGSPELEKQVNDVTNSAMSSVVDSSGVGYSKIGGSGPQASLQTSSNIRTTADESVSSLAKKALESLGGNSGSSAPAPVKQASAGGD